MKFLEPSSQDNFFEQLQEVKLCTGARLCSAKNVNVVEGEIKKTLLTIFVLPANLTKIVYSNVLMNVCNNNHHNIIHDVITRHRKAFPSLRNVRS